MITLSKLKELPLNEIPQHIKREQLIILISEQQLSHAITACNHFQLNGMELAEVVSRFVNDKSLKMELIKGMIIHCPNSRSDYFIEKALRICETILHDDNGNGMHARMFCSIYKSISRHHDNIPINVELSRKTAHFKLDYSNSNYMIDDILHSKCVNSDDLTAIISNNHRLYRWFEHLKLDEYPECYRDVLERQSNKLKLLGHI